MVSQKHQYYSEVIGIFKTFKDAWRNTISHAHEVHVESKRLLFDSVEAAAIMDHAETFMKKLTEKVIEKI